MLPADVVKKDLKQWEGELPFMYLDPENYLTIGIGCRISLEQAQDLDFVFREDQASKTGPPTRRKGDLATDDEIANDYTEVEAHRELESNPHQYIRVTKLILSDDDLDELFAERVEKAEGYLQKLFPDYDSFPAPAQSALLDMVFNMGSINFHNLKEAVRHRQWAIAATECHRKPKDPDLVEAFEARNLWTAGLFWKAAIDDKKLPTDENTSDKIMSRTVKTEKHSAKHLQLKPKPKLDSALVAPRAQGRR